MKNIQSSTYFGKGLMNRIGYAIQESENTNIVFVNSILTPMQQRKLEKQDNK